MQYKEMIPAIFLERPNRFAAMVQIGKQTEKVHVKNTGRCRELLLPGTRVYLTAGNNPERRTKYDLVTVQKEDGALVNIDSQAPNKVVAEWLQKLPFSSIQPEFCYGDSRVDFRLGQNASGETVFTLLEVKGCTLQKNGIGYFPDAPTERGVKHLRELMRARSEGLHAAIAFVIQMEGITMVKPNAETDQAFTDALLQAQKAGVQVLYLPCSVQKDGLSIRENMESSKILL